MGIYVFDIDGTIAKNGAKVEQTLCDSLWWLSQNNQLFFASARPVRDMLPMLPETLHKSVMIGCNGGMACKDGKIILSYTLPDHFVNRTLALLKTLGVPYVLDGEWHYSVSANAHPFHDYIRSLSHYEVSEQRLLQQGVTKILLLSDAHKEEVLCTIEKGQASVHQHRSDGFYDITPPGNNKYRTLFQLTGTNEYTAFGNDQNDYSMLENAATAVFISETGDTSFSGARYFAAMDEIPALLQDLENSRLSQKQIL